MIAHLFFTTPDSPTPLKSVMIPAGHTMWIDVPPNARHLTITTQQDLSSLSTPFVPEGPRIEFRDHVLAWLKKEMPRLEAVAVESVRGEGDDYGETDAEYSGSSIVIKYTDTKGHAGTEYVEGEDFISLWHWVVGVWPTAPPPGPSYPPEDVFRHVIDPDEEDRLAWPEGGS